jgi:hypothetical protein
MAGSLGLTHTLSLRTCHAMMQWESHVLPLVHYGKNDLIIKFNTLFVLHINIVSGAYNGYRFV